MKTRKLYVIAMIIIAVSMVACTKDPVVPTGKVFNQGSGTERYTITISGSPSSGGTVNGGGTYNQGTSCTVTATANEGYIFTNWTENGNVVSTSASYTFTVTANRALKANFTNLQPDEYVVNVMANPTEGGVVTGGGTYQEGQNCITNATANSGYGFTNWTENDNVVSTDANYSFTVTANRNLVANFTTQTPETYIISVLANPTEGGTVSGDGDYQQGQSCTVIAIANSGYAFINWTENGTHVSVNDNYTFTINSNRTLVANFSEIPAWPNGVLPGVFSVSSTQQVKFSQGNLQYQASTSTWRFAWYQWGHVGTQTPDSSGNCGGTINGSDNSSISQLYDGWIDLFGWGTSGWDNGNVYYQPYDWDCLHDWNAADFAFGYGPIDGTNYAYSLTGSYANADWGVYNAIINGGNTPNQWRTLTYNEWDYLFNSRFTSSGIRYAKGVVNGVNGVILLPDDWNTLVYMLNYPNRGDAPFTTNEITAESWVVMESAGAVFLPAAGHRDRTSIKEVGSCGEYWSASYSHTYNVHMLDFHSGNLDLTAYFRYRGLSVRLVHDINK